jgi:hypothetical protein
VYEALGGLYVSIDDEFPNLEVLYVWIDYENEE